MQSLAWTVLFFMLGSFGTPLPTAWARSSFIWKAPSYEVESVSSIVGKLPRSVLSPGTPHSSLREASSSVLAQLARDEFQVDGSGLTVAVFDTGLNRNHIDFSGKILTELNFTPDNDGRLHDATDGDGHGSNVAGIVTANGVHTGIAPGAKIIPVKVLQNNGLGDFDWIIAGMDWVIENHAQYQISAINLSIGTSENLQSIQTSPLDDVGQRIATLKSLRIPVIVSAGNDFFENNSQEGMSYPAIFPDTISVAAVFDADIGRRDYFGPIAHSSRRDQIAPFSQRLHHSTSQEFRTDLFAPGAALKSSGYLGTEDSTVLHGTSQATPIVTGLVLLLQEHYQRKNGILPTVTQLENWLRGGADLIYDGDDENDNVINTKKRYFRANTLSALHATGIPAPQMNQQAGLKIKRLKLTRKLHRSDEDRFSLNGVFPVSFPSRPVFQGKSVTVNLAGIARTFVLNKNGFARAKGTRIRMRYDRRTQKIHFNYRINRTTFDMISPLEIDSRVKTFSTVEMPVSLSFEKATYQNPASFKYRSHPPKGKIRFFR